MCNYLHVHCTLENHGEISEVYQMFKVNICTGKWTGFVKALLSLSYPLYHPGQ